MSLTDEQIQKTIIDGVKAGKISWLGYKKDEEDRYTIPVISKSDMQLSRAIESATAAPLLEQIKELERQLEWAREDAADADRMCKALAAVIDKDDARWKFLHTTNKDAEGFEWCVMRVKWENGRISEAWHTNSNLSDLDFDSEKCMKGDDSTSNKAYGWDYESYKAGVYVGPKFGCIHWVKLSA